MPDETSDSGTGSAVGEVRVIISGKLRAGATPDEVTADLDVTLTDEQWAGCRSYFLSRFVGDVNRAVRDVRPPRIDQPASTPAPADEKVIDLIPAQSPSRRGRGKPAVIRSWWHERLNGTWRLDGVEVRLGEMTASDCLRVAEENHEQATRNVAVARRFERLAARMQAAGATKVADLDEQAGRAVWENEARA